MTTRNTWSRRDDLGKLYEADVILWPGSTPVIQGDWQLVLNTGKAIVTSRRYHQHGERWYCVVVDAADGPSFRSTWKCGRCGERVPDEMEGYITLARWALNDKA
ncbi:hypothetical protein LCGC14_0208150 [marine sediment metagenome]|uniref:Uncharacterized protein n=1 Tax=marine sediment metagenome TaxID=412755 RepID=A0A0F9UL10_9ZZZZ